MAYISLQRFTGLNASERLRYGGQLADAAQSTPQLERELPLVASGYSHQARAALRLTRISRNAGAHKLLPYVIVQKDVAIGVASAQMHWPKLSGETPKTFTSPAYELSYWHRPQSEVDAHDVGLQVVRSLATAAKSEPYSSEPLWSLTLVDDEIKSAVLDELQFKPSPPEAFDIGDEVVEPRVLWQRG